MATLSITDFSCLREAVLTLSPVNIIIGPQGSGKSVTTKLFYFFAEIPHNFLQAIERGENIEEYKKHLSKVFNIWFPPSAWGAGRSNINYTSGKFNCRVLRRMSKGKLTDQVSITFSEWFTEKYKNAQSLMANAQVSEEIELGGSEAVTSALDKAWRVRDLVNRSISSELGDEDIVQQTFIPAGRAFFTSIGRLVAGFEQAGSLDPVTIKFARLFASLRDRNARQAGRISRVPPELRNRRAAFMNNLFGGEIKFEDESEYIEAADGRKIPFSSLSSGQQELLPMWSLIDYFVEIDAIKFPRTIRARKSTELLYIEEPEAHLFPSAQSMLMEFLIGSVISERKHRSLIVTTHSPYIMSKINVFLKAGSLARRKRKNQEINEVVPRECWLTEAQVSAYALEGGELKNIVDSDGLIDGRYLDNVSEQIAREFSRLLKIEADM